MPKQENGEPMSDLIRRDKVLGACTEEAHKAGRYKLGEIWELNYCEIGEAIESIPSAKPKEYVKDGTLTIQMPTIKEAKAIDKIVVYADTYKQEYYMPLPKVGKWIDDDKLNEKLGTYFANCSLCGYEMDVHDNRGYFNYCPNCGAKMERSE